MIENEDGEPIYNASIKVYQLINNNWQYIDHDITSSKWYSCSKESFKEVFVDPNGDYYRLLADGSYAIQVKKPGYETQTQYVKVHNKDLQTDAQHLDFTLQATSSERADLQRMLQQYMNKVWIFNSHLFFYHSIFFRNKNQNQTNLKNQILSLSIFSHSINNTNLVDNWNYFFCF